MYNVTGIESIAVFQIQAFFVIYDNIVNYGSIIISLNEDVWMSCIKDLSICITKAYCILKIVIIFVSTACLLSV